MEALTQNNSRGTKITRQAIRANNFQVLNELNSSEAAVHILRFRRSLVKSNLPFVKNRYSSVKQTRGNSSFANSSLNIYTLGSTSEKRYCRGLPMERPEDCRNLIDDASTLSAGTKVG